MSAVVLIVGLITATAAQQVGVLYRLYLLNQQTQELATIHTAIAFYFSANGHLPCAANPALPQSDPNFGVGSPCTGADTAPPLRAAGAAGRPGTVRIGAVPVRDLGLANSYAINPWGYRFTYAVTEALTQRATYNAGDGAIDVVDGNNVTVLPGGVAGTALYALVDPGIDGAGAYSGDAGVLHAPCPAGGMETANCTGGATFRAMPISMTPGPGYFDDTAQYRTYIADPSVITSLTQGYVLFGSPTGGLAQDTPLFFYDSTNHRLGVGTNTPLSTLDVNGGLSVGSYAGTSAAPANGMIVSGNVGIGTSNPNYSLDVYGSPIHAQSGYATQPGNNTSSDGHTFNIAYTNGTPQLWIDRTNFNTIATDGSSPTFNNVTANWGYATKAGTQSAPDGHTFNIDWLPSQLAGPTGQLWIDSTNVGTIATFGSDPTFNNVTATGGYSTKGSQAPDGHSFNIDWTGTAQLWVDSVNVGTFAFSSDRRLKKDVQILPDETGLTAIKRLHPVSFYWINPESGTQKQFGFIAQDVEKVLPNLVRNTGMKTALTPDGMRHLDYNGLIAPIVKAVQELYAKWSADHATLAALIAANDKLRADDDNLRALVTAQGRALEQLKKAQAQ